jgi:hypothetical protein
MGPKAGSAAAPADRPGRTGGDSGMTKDRIATGVVHAVPPDLRGALASDARALAKWNDLTPLARNEWICWVVSAKKPETRMEHVERTRTELKEGVRRPCCWIGCIHRTDKAISPSVRRILSRRSGKAKGQAP